nr:hypothetical protein [uncultured Duganella sp.]
MMHSSQLSAAIPPRRNELGAQLARLETLGRQALDCGEQMARLNLRCGREATLGGLAATHRLLVAPDAARRAELLVPNWSALGGYLSEAAAISAELQSAWCTWADAALSNGGEQWLRQLSSPHLHGGWGAQTLDLMRQALSGGGAPRPAKPAPPRARAAAGQPVTVA